MKSSTYRRCGCRDPETGQQLGNRCPDRQKKRHGTWGYAARLATTTKVRQLKRHGFKTQTDAEAAFENVEDLVALAGDDLATRQRIGDLIFAKTRNNGPLPELDDVRTRLGLGKPLDDPAVTVGEWLTTWLAGKRKLRESVQRSYGGHLRNWLIPFLGELRLDRLTAEHIEALLNTIEAFNEEIRAARAEKRRPVLPNDVRPHPRIAGAATQRRIFATLRVALNAAVKKRKIPFNPCHGVELPEEWREPELTWEPGQVRTFLISSAEDPLHLLYRIILLRGPRRGEALGVRWADLNDRTGELAITKTLLQLGGKLVHGRPKTRAGQRVIVLDENTLSLLAALRLKQAQDKLAAGSAYEDNDLIFCDTNGRPISPDYASDHFKHLADAAGLHRIKLHGGRHTAATLALEAGIDIKIVSDQLGHSTTRITQDLYQKTRRKLHADAAEKIIQLIDEPTPDEETKAS